LRFGKRYCQTRKVFQFDQEKLSGLSWQSLASILDLLHVLYQQVSPIVIDVEQVHRMRHHDTEITSELQAKAAAKRILKNVSNPGARYLEEEDLLRFFKKSKVAFVFPQFGGAVRH